MVYFKLWRDYDYYHPPLSVRTLGKNSGVCLLRSCIKCAYAYSLSLYYK
ncbi:restriction modification system DNA specificity subunit [Escherichia phage IMM-002]|uniref:Restriction modification system DNA specificity subunit n=1 Tax=Escherichia phage IMM-002 TaxID=2041760 RepID=A0A384X8D5_9CAUD|nr:restriction modification system DNA specificity subunit [Escherichia phage IMM-002]ATI17037.1 restriction modification system DNA specificity subunit [Escherichia phage IMM-002]